MKRTILSIVVFALLTTQCSKKCPIASCEMVLDHQHFFGAENDQTGEVIRKDAPLPANFNADPKAEEKEKKGLLGGVFKKRKKNESDSTIVTTSDNSGIGGAERMDEELTEDDKLFNDPDDPAQSSLNEDDEPRKKSKRKRKKEQNADQETGPKSISSTLPVYRGVPWWRRIFKKRYRTEEGLKYKDMEKHRYSGKNKQQLQKIITK